MLPLIAFTLSVTLHRAPAQDQTVTIKFDKSSCTVNDKKVERDVCATIYAKAREPMSDLPWVNAGDPARFILTYRDEKTAWEKQAGLRADKERASIQALAHAAFDSIKIHSKK